MKVVCEGCQAKYRLPDDRISGRKLKIRCRRCGGTMVIEGEHGQVSASGALLDPSTPPGGMTLPPPVEAMQRPSQPVSATPQWHISVDGAESGPYSLAQVVQRLQSGAVPWDAYLWRDGFAEWIGVQQCAEVTERVAPPAVAPAPPAVMVDDAKTRIHQSGAYAPVMAPRSSAPVTPARSAVPTPVPSRSVPALPALGVHALPQVAAARNLSQAPLLLEDPDAATSMVRPSSRPTYRPSSQPPLQSSPDAVLFSASQLGHVARPGGTSRAPQSRPGFAGGDSSGLVDIAALASLTRPSAAPPVPRAALRPGSMPTTPTVQLQPLPAVLDSLAPTSRRSSGSNKTVPLAILASSAMMASATFAAILITRSAPPAAPPPTPTPVVAAAQPVPPAPVPVPAAAPPVPAVAEVPAPTAAADDDDDKEGVPAAVAPSAAEPAVAEAVATPVEVAAAPQPEAAAPVRARGAKRGAKPARTKQAAAKAAPAAEDEALFAEKAAPAEKPAPAKAGGSDVDDLLLADAPAKPAPAAAGNSDVDDLLGSPAPKKPAAKRSIDDLLDTAVTDAAQKPSAKAAAPAAAPAAAAAAAGLEAPGREDVLKAIKGVTPAVRACAQGQSGVAKVAITVSGSSGQVTSAQANGVDDPIKSCIEDAVRDAEFPRFSKPTFRVDYPFKF
jgi:predicted Zn finger-like uncharacterized protein